MSDRRLCPMCSRRADALVDFNCPVCEGHGYLLLDYGQAAGVAAATMARAITRHFDEVVDNQGAFVASTELRAQGIFNLADPLPRPRPSLAVVGAEAPALALGGPPGATVIPLR